MLIHVALRTKTLMRATDAWKSIRSRNAVIKSIIQWNQKDLPCTYMPLFAATNKQQIRLPGPGCCLKQCSKVLELNNRNRLFSCPNSLSKTWLSPKPSAGLKVYTVVSEMASHMHMHPLALVLLILSSPAVSAALHLQHQGSAISKTINW